MGFHCLFCKESRGFVPWYFVQIYEESLKSWKSRPFFSSFVPLFLLLFMLKVLFCRPILQVFDTMGAAHCDGPSYLLYQMWVTSSLALLSVFRHGNGWASSSLLIWRNENIELRSSFSRQCSSGLTKTFSLGAGKRLRKVKKKKNAHSVSVELCQWRKMCAGMVVNLEF